MNDPAERTFLQAFHGGLELPDQKDLSLNTPLTAAGLPRRLYVPIGQHQGEAGDVLVAAGQQVLAGQPLTASDDDFQVPAHAPCSGQVVGLCQRPASHPPNSLRRCIELRPDDRNEHVDPSPLPSWRGLPADALVDHLRAMGLAGLGGAVFPTAAKLRGDWEPMHTLILNGAECEPWISCDETLMRGRPDAVVTGGRILAAAAGARRILLAIESRAGDTAAALAKAAADASEEMPIEIIQLPAVYPQGGERQLIEALTGLQVPYDGLPQDLGILCHNVATAAAAFDAVEGGRALTERIVTVTGPGVARPCNLQVAIGTPISHLIDLAGGYCRDVRRLVLGGPMSGTALASDEVVITKGSNCILVLTAAQTDPRPASMPCINCGFCVTVCPASLMPQLLFRALAADRHEQARELQLFDCIECGCCAQVCPSHIPLVDYYRHGKALLRRQDLDQRRATLARRRHEARQVRLDRQREEREARRRARVERLTTADSARDDIQAAIERARRKKRGPD